MSRKSLFKIHRKKSCGTSTDPCSLHEIISSSSPSSTLSNPTRTSLNLPHTITERRGGNNLWVKAPVLVDAMEKQGFRWRKKWKRRWVQLNGRELTYFDIKDMEELPEGEDLASKRSRLNAVYKKKRGTLTLTAQTTLQEIDNLTFSIIPNDHEKPWNFRAKDVKMKLKWYQALTDCIDILTWLRHYIVGDILGVGGNGIVRTVVDSRNGRKFALKVVDASRFKNRESIVAEVEILRRITNNICHPNLIQIFKVYEENDKIFIALELCKGGELYHRIVEKGKYSEADAVIIMKQLISSLQVLHEHNILHLDLKPENILFATQDEDSKIILTDFGLARMINGKANPLHEGTTIAGTVGYIAPEVITSHLYTCAADVFSAGVILYILLVGYPPFVGDSEVEIMMKIARGNYVFHEEDWKEISRSAKDLVLRMISVQMQERITVKEILEHPWITSQGAQNNRELSNTILRMKQFNIDRKTESIGAIIGSMLIDIDQQDYEALIDVQVIETIMRQICSIGALPLNKAHVLVKAFGVSPYIDEHDFVNFLDRNHDGMIDPNDFCESMKVIREVDATFGKIVFDALIRMRTDPNGSSTPQVLTRKDLEVALIKLDCPDQLTRAFFKDVHTLGVSSSSTEENEDFAFDDTQFRKVLSEFRFLIGLFFRNAKNKVVSIVRTGVVEMPRISE